MPLRDVCSAADLQAAAEKPLCILHVSNAGLAGSAVAQDCYVIAKLPHETFTVHVSPGAVFCINSVHQQTSASHPAAETECWELFPARWGRLGVTPPPSAWDFLPYRPPVGRVQSPLCYLLLPNPILQQPILSLHFDLFVPPGKFPGVFISKHTLLPTTTLSPLRVSKQNILKSTRMLSKLCSALRFLCFPSGLLLLFPLEQSVPGSNRC